MVVCECVKNMFAVPSPREAIRATHAADDAAAPDESDVEQHGTHGRKATAIPKDTRKWGAIRKYTGAVGRLVQGHNSRGRPSAKNPTGR